MGNILQTFTSAHTSLQNQKMKRPFVKPALPKQQNHLQPSRNQLNANKINPNVNIKKGGNQKIQLVSQFPKKSINDKQILAKVLSLVIQQLQFDQMWGKFTQIVQPIFKFNLLFPVPINEHGEKMLNNGLFVVSWLKIMSKNMFINMPMIYKAASEQYLSSVSIDKQVLQAYFKQFQLKQQNRTPSKSLKKQQSLKRSILKNSEKKVKFGANQIIYPQLYDYKTIFVKNNQKIKRKQEISKNQGFILDYFEINDIYLLEQVQLVGVIKQYDSCYAIIQVKLKSNLSERTCIGITHQNNIKGHSLKTLQTIEKQFQNLGYLELQGKDPSAIWVDSLPYDSQK